MYSALATKEHKERKTNSARELLVHTQVMQWLLRALLALCAGIAWICAVLAITAALALRAGCGNVSINLYIAAPLLAPILSIIGAAVTYCVLSCFFRISPRLLLLCPVIFTICIAGYFLTPSPYKAFLAGFSDRVRKQVPVVQLEEWARNEMREGWKSDERVQRISGERLPEFIREFASPRVPTTVMWRVDPDAVQALSINLGGKFMNWGIIVFAHSNHVLNPDYDYRLVGKDAYAFHTR